MTSNAPQPLLSVLVPAWNAAGTIERALASILVEREVSLECVVIDDGSTDGTADVAARMAADDPRIVLIRGHANRGVSAARNQGLAVARGAWLLFVDADDRLLDGGIAAVVRPMADPTVRAVIGQRIWSDGAGSWISAAYDRPDIREPGRKSIATHPGLLYYAALTGKAFHRSIVEGLTFYGRVLGDQPWTVRALLRAGPDIVVIPDTVYEWTRPSPGSAVETITSGKRVSAARASEAVLVAMDAYQHVDAEAATVLDPEQRRQVAFAYFERLVRSDFAGPVRDTVERTDPTTGTLYAAIGRFLAIPPAASLVASAAMREKILRPPLHHWMVLDSAAREAYWDLVDVVRRIDRRALEGVSPHRLARLALWLADRTDGRTRARLVWLPLMTLGRAGGIVNALARWLRLRRTPPARG